MKPVTADDVQDLIPGAPAPEDAHIALATLWAASELGKHRVTLGVLTGTAADAARAAIAAKSLALKAGLDGAISLGRSATGGGLKGIKVPGLELTLNPTSVDEHGKATVAAADWEAFAQQFLQLAVPVQVQRPWFPGASR